jgi:hypothetical protein
MEEGAVMSVRGPGILRHHTALAADGKLEGAPK